MTPTEPRRARAAGRYMRRSSLRAVLLVLLGLDAFIIGSLGIALTTSGHHGVVWWLALVPLTGLGGYLVFRTVRVWAVLRRL